MSPFALEQRVAVVTGALGLLGREHCWALAEAGARVVVADLDGEGSRSFAAEIAQRFPDAALGTTLDVSSAESIAAMTALVLQKWDRVDVLVNNAAVDDKVESPELLLEQSQFENYPLSSWEKLLRVNLTGVFLCCQHLAPLMANRGRGSIVNIASTYGVVAPQQDLYKDAEGRQAFYKGPAYPVTKAGVLQLTRYLAAYYGRRGVRVNALSPGGVNNHQSPDFQARYADRVPLGRMAERGDYRGALVFLASDASSYMTGANLIVDGGWTAW
jgi:NAD(P)-dependent dehydrogenase (short-subunit alcohol dehydrogenase family)